LLPPEQERGFGLIPEPDPGDLFFDIEGYPHFEPRAGLEYLFGIVGLERGTPQFRAFWGKDRQAEREMFEGFIDVVRERLASCPNLHIYHYAVRPTKLKADAAPRTRRRRLTTSSGVRCLSISSGWCDRR
jgi:uncharacterized protein